MSDVPDFLKNIEDEAIDDNSMNELEALIKAYDETRKRVEEIEKALKEETEKFNVIALTRLPEFLLSHGIKKMSLKDGREVNIKEDISATIKDEIAFRNWLRDRKEEEIIKIKYAFSKLSSNAIDKLSDFLINNDYDFEIDESIHAATKKKYFKELIKEIGRNKLPEWVSIYDIRQAVIK